MKKIIATKLFGDKDVELIVGQLLRYGVVTSSIIVFIGGIFYLAKHGQQPVPSYHVFVGEGKEYTTFSGIFKGAANLQVAEIIQLGVLALIATPILRIVFSLFAFILEKDKLYIGITLIVLIIMLSSMFGGLAG